MKLKNLKPNDKNIFSYFFMIIIFFSIYLKKEKGNYPPPTEIIERKKDRKVFKVQRKEWMKAMHQSEPGLDWKKINSETRKEKFIEKTKNKLNNIQNREYSRNPMPVPGEWHERGSNNQAGRIRTSFVDHNNDEIYCASSGGNIWRGGIDGSNWVSLNDYFQIKGIHYLNRIELSSGTRMLMINDKDCYRTDDDGYIIQGSTGLENIQDWGWIFRARMANDSYQTIYLAVIEWDYAEWTYLPAIYSSIDNGETFNKILELTAESGFDVGTDKFDIWISKNLNSNLVILNDGLIYSYNNQTNSALFVSDINPPESGNNILIGGVTENGEEFYHTRIGNNLHSSYDSGSSWQNMGELPTGTFTINSFECSDTNPYGISIGNVDGYTTSDGGQNWQLINHWWEYYSTPETKLHADLPEFTYDINPATLEEFHLICTDGGIYISYDNFQTVENLSMNGLGVSQYYSTYTAKEFPHHIFAGSQDQGFQRHLTDGDYNGILDFEQTISGDYGHIVSTDGGNSLWTDYPGFIMYYPDIANSTEMISWDFQGSGYLWLPPLMNDPDSPNIAYIGGGGINSQNHIVKVTHGVGGITAADLNYSFPSRVSSMAYSSLNHNNWYVSTEDGKFYYSLDSGQDFIQTASFSGPESHYFYGSTILPSPTDNQRIYIGGSGYSNPAVYVSEDGGETFSSFDEGLPNTLVYELACIPDESIIFAATEVGPYAYSQQQGEWVDISDDSAPEQVYWSVEYIHEIRTARFGTYGRGIWDYTFDYNPVLILGDVNQDELVNIDDLIFMITILLTNENISEDTFFLADIDYNDVIDIYDMLLLVDFFQ